MIFHPAHLWLFRALTVPEFRVHLSDLGLAPLAGVAGPAIAVAAIRVAEAIEQDWDMPVDRVAELVGSFAEELDVTGADRERLVRYATDIVPVTWIEELDIYRRIDVAWDLIWRPSEVDDVLAPSVLSRLRAVLPRHRWLQEFHVINDAVVGDDEEEDPAVKACMMFSLLCDWTAFVSLVRLCREDVALAGSPLAGVILSDMPPMLDRAIQQVSAWPDP